MGLNIEPTGAACGAYVTGIDLSTKLSEDLVAEIRARWLEHKVLAFPDQSLTNHDLERFTRYFGAFGEDPFFGHIDGHPNIAAIQRDAEETTPIFAETFHTDWSFLDIPPAGTVLYGIEIPPQGGNTLFADQVKAYARLSDQFRDQVDSLTAIHSARRGYAPSGAYGDKNQASGRSMAIEPSEKAMATQTHPLVRVHRETGQTALYSSASYIIGFESMPQHEADVFLMELYAHQTHEELVYSHPWQKDMLVMWDNRSLLHAATGGYDGHARRLHRTTIADTAF